ncbi:MAG: hypothetical protein BIFFINMI_02727 [Phycisphaerae bacterium]|nr:hypothetical protein [Phycisphaerae bacterium]
MKFDREYYVELMTFGRVDRPMFCELFGPLVGLDAEWRAQGASDDEIGLEAFDWDWTPFCHCPAPTGAVGLPESVVLEDNAEFAVRRDGLGRTTKLIKRSATIALPLDWPVRDMDD